MESADAFDKLEQAEVQEVVFAIPTLEDKYKKELYEKYNAEGRPVWKSMHTQPMYHMNPFIIRESNVRGRTNVYIAGIGVDVGLDFFNRGLCLPSDNK